METSSNSTDDEEKGSTKEQGDKDRQYEEEKSNEGHDEATPEQTVNTPSENEKNEWK